MQLLHLIAGLDPEKGGVGQAVRTIATGLTELGLYNEIVCLDAPGSSFLSDAHLIIHTKGPGKGPWCYSPQLIPYLLKKLENFDGVIVHGLWLYHSYAIRKAFKILRKRRFHNNKLLQLPKLFIMPHGMLDPYFQKAKGRKLKALRNLIYWKLFENKLINEADGLLFTCECECKLAKVSFMPYKPQREIVIGLGVKEPPKYSTAMQEDFVNSSFGLASKPYFLFLSRIDRKKGLDILLNAYKIVLEKNILIPNLVIAGPGIGSAYGKQIKQLVINLNLDQKVFFTGMISGNSKWGAFYGCEALILPSHQENFGIAVVEALACSKPVLISNRVNIWREIENQGGGIVLNNSIQGTVEMIEKWLIMTAWEKSVMGKRARECYEENFAVTPVAQKIIKELEINQHHNKSHALL